LTNKWRKNNLKRKACKTNNPSDWESYRIEKNQYNRLIKNTVKTYYTDEISNNKGNIKNTWKSINKLISKQSKTSHVGHIRNENNEEVQDKDIPNAFNKHFIEVGQRLSRNIPITDKQPEAYINVSNARFHFQKVSQQEILNLLSNIATNKATGPDKISAKLVKVAAPIIANHLTIIFNKSLSEGTFPHDCMENL
jgi:hypothetical protein